MEARRNGLSAGPACCVLALAISMSGQTAWAPPFLATAQGQTDPGLARFDFAYVERARPGGQGQVEFIDRGQAVYVNATMLDLISDAYGVDENNVLGGPAWLTEDLYNLRAKTSAAATQEQVQQLLQAFLIERFSLVAHTELRPLPAYALTVSGGGPKFKAATSASGPSGCQVVPIAAGTTPGRTAREIACTSMSMGELAKDLANFAPAYIDHPVIDKTGLTGNYDFSLKWIGRGALRNPGDADYDPANDISMFAAVEKIGLKLTPVQAPATVVVVDSVQPTPLVDADHPMLPPPPMPTAFDVASIKAADNASPQDSMFQVSPGGEVEICCFSLSSFIQQAFPDLDTRRIINAPKWLGDDKWDIRAKTVPGATFFDVAVMLQNLLKSRFQFAYHEETQPIPVFVLKAGNHPKLVPSKGGRSDCSGSASNGNRVLTCTNMAMGAFANDLWDYARGYFDKPVVDGTGLKGSYDFTVTFATAGRTGYNGAGRGTSAAGGSPPAITTPSGAMTIFEAIDRQLGLKFTTEKRPQRVIVIDHLERTPTDD